MEQELMNGWSKTREFLNSIELPAETRSYRPIAHKIILDRVEKELDNHSLRIVNTNFKINRLGNQMVATYGISGSDPLYNMSVSVGNSYDKTIKVGISGGVQTGVCLNGKIFGDIIFQRKHTGSVMTELNHNIIHTIANLHAEYDRGVAILNRMKEIELTKKTIAQLVGEAYINEGILNSTQLSIVKDRLTYDENFKDLNAYCLIEHFTEAAKTSHSTNYMRILKKTSNFFINQFEELSEFRS